LTPSLRLNGLLMIGLEVFATTLQIPLDRHRMSQEDCNDYACKRTHNWTDRPEDRGIGLALMAHSEKRSYHWPFTSERISSTC
jgi:hypothetical protein